MGLPPDFLWGLVRSRNLMRLSLQKAAHAKMGGAVYRKSRSPVFFIPRTPDFLSRLVALSNSMRLSLKESRTRGPVLCCVTANPGTLGRTWGTLCYSVRIGGGDYLRRNRPLHHPRLNLSLRPMCGKAVLPFVRGVPSAVPRLRGNKKSIFPSGAGTRPR